VLAKLMARLAGWQPTHPDGAPFIIRHPNAKTSHFLAILGRVARASVLGSRLRQVQGRARWRQPAKILIAGLESPGKRQKWINSALDGWSVGSIPYRETHQTDQPFDPAAIRRKQNRREVAVPCTVESGPAGPWLSLADPWLGLGPATKCRKNQGFMVEAEPAGPFCRSEPIVNNDIVAQRQQARHCFQNRRVGKRPSRSRQMHETQ